MGLRSKSRPPSDAFDLAVRFLAARPRSELEIRRRLARAAVTDVEPVLARLRSLNLVDDAAFARYWVEQRQTFRPRGARMLRAELRQYGVAAEPRIDEAEAAYRAGAKKARQLACLDEPTFRSRLSGFLARRGFEWEVITEAVERLWAEHQPPQTAGHPRT